MPGSQKDPPDAVSKFSSLWCDISGQAPVRHTQHERETKGSNQQIINITSTKRIYRNNTSLCVYNKKRKASGVGGNVILLFYQMYKLGKQISATTGYFNNSNYFLPVVTDTKLTDILYSSGKNAIQQFKWHVTNHWLGIRRDPLPTPNPTANNNRSVGGKSHPRNKIDARLSKHTSSLISQSKTLNVYLSDLFSTPTQITNLNRWCFDNVFFSSFLSRGLIHQAEDYVAANGRRVSCNALPRLQFLDFF